MKRVYYFITIWVSQNKILTVILILAVFLRFIGIYPGFPLTHSDEGIISVTAVRMIVNLTYDPMRYDYAALSMILHAIIYLIIHPFFIIYRFFFVPDSLPRFINILSFYQNILLQNQQTSVVYWARFITASFGIGIVFMVYQVAVRFFNKKSVGLIAAFLTAVNFRQVLNSHITLPDIYNAFFLLLCFYIFWNLLKKPNTKNYLLSGIIVGLYLSVKFHVFAIATFITLHIINTWDSIKDHRLMAIFRHGKRNLNNLFRYDFIISILLIFVVFIIINPYLFLHLSETIATNQYQALQYRIGIKNLYFYPIAYLYFIGIGRMISILVVFGIVWGLIKYTRSTIIFISFIVPFFYFLIYYGNGGFYIRNFVTVIPLLLIFAGLFLADISLLIGQKLRLGRNLSYCLMVLTLLIISWEPLKNSVISTYYFSQPQNYRIAKQWAEENIPNGVIVAARTIDKFDKKKKFKIVNFEYKDVFSLAEMQEAGVDYGYVPLDELNGAFYWWMRTSTQESLDYWNKSVPDSISQNMFTAKVANELAPWSIAAFIKPWQSPDVNYLVVKVPKKLEIYNKMVMNTFAFNEKESLSSWSLIWGDEQRGEISFDALIGKSQNGSLKISKGTVYPSVALATSPLIPITYSEGGYKAYELSAWIKSADILTSKEKDGFLRIDFYKSDPGKITLTSKSFSTALSSRIYGISGWVKKSITVIAPPNSKFMTISMGVDNPNLTDFWFDDIILSESEDNIEDPRVKLPYLNYYQIPQNILFPVSHGNW